MKIVHVHAKIRMMKGVLWAPSPLENMANMLSFIWHGRLCNKHHTSQRIIRSNRKTFTARTVFLALTNLFITNLFTLAECTGVDRSAEQILSPDGVPTCVVRTGARYHMQGSGVLIF